MPVNGYDIELNGIGYNLAEDAEGDHFALSGEPLRPPNAVTVQGEQRNRFQVRPDILLWTLTDWSGGEGQIKYDFRQPNRWRELEVVQVFERPGELTPGWDTKELEDSTAILAEEGTLVFVLDKVWMLDNDDPEVREWNKITGEWSAATTLTGPSNGASSQAAVDTLFIYWHEDTTDNVWKWPLSGNPTQIDSGGMANFSDALVAQLGSYVYVYSPSAGEVWEIAKSGGSEVLIDDFGDEPSAPLNGGLGIIPMDGRLYVLVNHWTGATIREITPTTASGTGFGAEIARFHGFQPDAMWAHSGTLYVGGRYGEPNNATVLYVTPGGDYGSLGRVRAGNSLTILSAGVQNGDMLSHYFVTATGSIQRVYQIDAITGGFACIAEFEDFNFPGMGVLYQQFGYLWSSLGSSDDRTYRANAEAFAASSHAISPWHDFDLADEKILSSVVLSCEALPADWTIYVDYAQDGDTTWTNAITYTTDDGTGTSQRVSTDSSTVKFRTLSIRIRMEYGGVADPVTTAPVVLGVDVLSQVAKIQPVYRLLLDLSDEKGKTPKALTGTKKYTNIKSAGDLEQVVAFKDGYSSRDTVTEMDVVIDSYAMVLSTPGEGHAQVTLREVL